MYLRFVIAERIQDSGRDLGVLHAVRNLEEEERLDAHELEQVEIVRDWFNQHLEKPTRLTASKPPFYRKQNKAISWFKDTAHEHIARVRELVVILEHQWRCGADVEDKSSRLCRL